MRSIKFLIVALFVSYFALIEAVRADTMSVEEVCATMADDHMINDLTDAIELSGDFVTETEVSFMMLEIGHKRDTFEYKCIENFNKWGVTATPELIEELWFTYITTNRKRR